MPKRWKQNRRKVGRVLSLICARKQDSLLGSRSYHCHVSFLNPISYAIYNTLTITKLSLLFSRESRITMRLRNAHCSKSVLIPTASLLSKGVNYNCTPLRVYLSRLYFLPLVFKSTVLPSVHSNHVYLAFKQFVVETSLNKGGAAQC